MEETKIPSDLLREGTKENLSTLECETGRNRHVYMHTPEGGLTTILCACRSIIHFFGMSYASCFYQIEPQNEELKGTSKSSEDQNIVSKVS